MLRVRHWMAWTLLLAGSMSFVLDGCLPKVERACRNADDCKVMGEKKYCFRGICSTQQCEAGEARTCFEGAQNVEVQGQCKKGQQTCLTNQRWSACLGQVLARPEVCDREDNDCNGKVDDGIDCSCKPGTKQVCYNGPVKTEGTGPCLSGVQTCEIDNLWGRCRDQFLPQDEVCDKRDNDCNGKVDDSPECQCEPGTTQACFTGPPGAVLQGSTSPCQEGVQLCGVDRLWQDKCLGQVLPQQEQCNGRDDDCDGQVDEAEDLKERAPLCSKQQGVCKGSTKRCGGDQGWIDCGPSEYAAHSKGASQTFTYETDEQTCDDNLDNDCDGKADEGCGGACPQAGVARPCYVADTATLNVGECRAGTQVCQTNLTWGACQGERSPQPEVCDGKDNNCNGTVDESASCPTGFRCESSQCVAVEQPDKEGPNESSANDGGPTETSVVEPSPEPPLAGEPLQEAQSSEPPQVADTRDGGPRESHTPDGPDEPIPESMSKPEEPVSRETSPPETPLPDVTLPEVPLPDVNLPELPLPDLPLPELPNLDLPVTPPDKLIPELQGPELPDVSIPLPDQVVPELPVGPELPNADLPVTPPDTISDVAVPNPDLPVNLPEEVLPELPNGPELPSGPELPIGPEIPTGPDLSQGPETTVGPDLSIGTDLPPGPEKILGSDNTSTPELVSGPDLPAGPELPTKPESTSAPDEATQPEEPVGPEKPPSPEEPTQEAPAGPEDSVGPELPVTPELLGGADRPGLPEVKVGPELTVGPELPFRTQQGLLPMHHEEERKPTEETNPYTQSDPQVCVVPATTFQWSDSVPAQQ
ncbi:MAG: hypothetical protein EP343_00055 [Deltaproteobacteria bacterium]|nr:MAG: hypothetical protein EP343_00055 [Deltaproteobacteria bacterium]